LNVIKNIIPAVLLYDSLKYLAKFKKETIKARQEGDFEREREFILKSTGTWGRHLVKVFDIDLSVTGKENLPDSGPVVFVSNHQGYADIPVSFMALDKFQFAFVARDDLEKLPFYGKWMKQIRGVFLKRDDARASLRAINEGIDLLEKGFSLMIFPEGTRSRGGPVKEFKKGSLRLAVKPGIPVIPVTINGTYHIFEESGRVKKGVHVDLTIHPLIETKGMSKTESNDFAAVVEKIIRGDLAGQPVL
jgi:1-acyl-sn-glycerol-3-phosphate acyltransferase